MSENNLFENEQGKEGVSAPEIRKKIDRKVIIAIILCVVLSFCAAVAGITVGNQINAFFIKDEAAKNGVIYQSVKRQSSDGKDLEKMTTPEVVSNVSNSVVEISTETVQTHNYFGQFVSEGAGSGVIITANGYIVTNDHVIANASKILVRLKDGTKYEAKLIGTDPSNDLAVIKINGKNLKPATYGNSSQLKVGDKAIAIGNPLGELRGTVTEGIISARDREINVGDVTMRLLQIDAAVNPGNSGGGLFDRTGELVGIVNAKSSGEAVEGLGFAIPIDTAKTIIDKIIKEGNTNNNNQQDSFNL